MGQDDQPGAHRQPAARDLLFRAAFAEPGEILVRQFDDIRHRDHPQHALEMPGLVGDEGGADIGVEHDDAGTVFAPHQRFVCRSARLRDEADAAEVERGDIRRQDRQVVLGEHAAGRTLVEERIACVAVDELDEGQRGRPVREPDMVQPDAAVRQRLPELFAEEVGRQAGEEADRDLEPPERDRRVEDGSPDIGCECRLARRRLARQEIDQGFTATQDHRFPRSIVVSLHRVMVPRRSLCRSCPGEPGCRGSGRRAAGSRRRVRAHGYRPYPPGWRAP